MSTGKEAKAAFRKASQWGSAVAVTSADAFLFTSEKIARTREHLPDDSAGQAFALAADRGQITCGGDLSAYLRYQGLETLLAMAMGAAGPPAHPGASAYAHGLRLTPALGGLFGTLAVYKGFSVHEYPAVKVDGFTIEGQAGQPLTVNFHLICDDLNLNTAGGVNTNALLEAVAAPAPVNRVLFRQGAFWINDAEAAALTSANAVQPSRFSLSFRRKMKGDYLAGGADRIAEPIADGLPEISLSLEFPHYTSDTYLSDLGADVRKKMRVAFTGDQIEPGHAYVLELLFPHLVVTNAEAAVDRAGKIAHPVSLDCLATGEEREGMAGVTEPFALNLTNTRASDPLA